MKRLMLQVIALSVVLVSCQNNESSTQSDNDTATESITKKSEKNVSKRDLSITPENAYNDLFLDSIAVAGFIATQQLNDTIAKRIRSFYNARNYQFAWFASDGLTEQARAFWNLHNYYTTYSKDTSFLDKSLKSRMDDFTIADTISVSSSDKAAINTELKLTQHFIQYALKNFEPGTVKRKEMERFVPRKKEDALYLADSLLSKKHKDNKYFEDINEPYKLLRDQLQKYYNVALQGGWKTLPKSVRLKKGISSPAVLAIKNRLQITGEMPAGDTSDVFNEELENAIKTYQQRYGLTPTGTLSDALIKEMNVPVKRRIEQILINMDRMRWMATPRDGRLIVVNIPEFMLHLFEGKNKAFDMKVVVGKEGHNTVMFTGNLNQIVFSPYWNITNNIVKTEILPAMKRDPHYLSKHNMEITGNSGGIPVIRQLPGPENSLGKVKFLFPNDYNIYFHDTPAKSLFDRDKRAYSHGCIRLSDPVKMANYLLKDDSQWTPEKIEEAMNEGTEKYVKVKTPVPVMITYYTAWVDENGLLNFRDDIYGHDKHLIQKMFDQEAGIRDDVASTK